METMSRPAILLCCSVALLGCATGRTCTRQFTIAATFSKAAVLVFDIDHIDYDKPIDEALSPEDLVVLERHLDALVPMMRSALNRQDSVWAAKLAGHFKPRSLLPLLRSHLLVPRRCYGWEGPDYSKLESYLMDSQFQYSTAYLQAIEQITGESVCDAVVVSPDELALIQRHAANESSKHYHWALWIQRKLGIQESSGHGKR